MRTAGNPGATDNDGTFSLESADRPNFCKNLPENANWKSSSLTLHTENGNYFATENGQVSLEMKCSPTIDINAYGMSQLTKNVLSGEDIVCKQVPLVFTVEGAFRLPDQHFTILSYDRKFQSVRKCNKW